MFSKLIRLEIDKYMNKWGKEYWNKCFLKLLPYLRSKLWISYFITLRLNRCSEEPNDNNSRPRYKKNTVGMVEE